MIKSFYELVISRFFISFFCCFNFNFGQNWGEGCFFQSGNRCKNGCYFIFCLGNCFFQGGLKDLSKVSKFSFLFLILSGIATGLSWLFYFYALKVGEASKVVPIDKLSLVLTIVLAGLILKEKVTAPILIGSILMTAGALIIALVK